MVIPKQIAPLCLVLMMGCSQFPARTAESPAVGWRGDGMGRYADATPPIEWSNEENVVWAAPMPSWSNATPVIVGDKIFVCSEPFDLICVNKNDGEILWRDSCGYESLFAAEDWAKIEQDLEKAKPLEQEKRDLEKGLKAALKDDKDNLEKINALKGKIESLERELAVCGKFLQPDTHKVNGYSSATPVSDGKSVYAVFGNGVVVCYDMQGNRKWGRLVQKPFVYANWGFSASPVLADGKLIVHFDDLAALDPSSGRELWRTDGDTGSELGRYGTPAVASIGGDTVLVLAGGQVVRASDGKMLGNAPDKAELKYASPVVEDGVAYFMQFEGKAVKLPGAVSEPLELTALWDAKLKDNPKTNRYYGSALIHGGLVYSISSQNDLSIQDIETGETVVAEKRMDLGKGTTYPSLTLAGGHIYASSDNGTTIVLKPGKDCESVAANDLGEAFRCCPVFEGRRMYIRGYERLFCIGGND